MTQQVVQAKCPHCQTTLRIPSEWLAKAMRCKHCKRTFQAKMKAATANPMPAPSVAVGPPVKPKAKAASAVTVLERNPAPQVAAPAAAVVAAPPAPKAAPQAEAVKKAPIAAPPAKPTSDNPFGFDEDAPAEETTSVKPRQKSGAGGMLVLVLMFFFLFIVGAGAAGYVVYRVVMPVAPSDDNSPFANADAANAVKNNGNPQGDKGSVVPAGDNKGKKAPPFVVPPRKDKDGKKPPPFSNDPYPRRALLISVSNYLMFSTVHYGTGADSVRDGYPGSSTSVLRDRLNRLPLNFPLSQITELSDAIPPESKTAKAHSTQKSVIETTIRDFIDSSRAQDRILVLFAGHGAVVDDKSYLVPIDGNLQDPATLVPLKWVYDQLAKCPAQQKILILDTFRYSPSKGFELPSPGEGAEGQMPEAFDKELQSPPVGVQVWASCVKEQSAIEGERGSAFMNALCGVLSANAEMRGFSTPADPIPVDELVVKVNQRLNELLTSQKRTQVSRLTGKALETAVAYNKDEPLPAPLALKPPTAAGGEAAPIAQVDNILDELRMLPAVRDTRAGDLNLLKAQNLPAFSAKRIDGFKADGYKDISDLQKKYKAGPAEFAKQYPLRAAYFEALDALQESSKVKPREVISKADTDPKRKALFLQEQEPLGISIFKLEQALAAVLAAREQREMETSKRWQANFDYTQARLQARLVYLFEYNYTLGQIRADNLPELAPTQNGWRVGITGSKINVTERKAKDLAKDNVKLWKSIQDDYPGTPWALLSQRESVIALGLAWRPKSD